MQDDDCTPSLRPLHRQHADDRRVAGAVDRVEVAVFVDATDFDGGFAKRWEVAEHGLYGYQDTLGREALDRNRSPIVFSNVVSKVENASIGRLDEPCAAPQQPSLQVPPDDTSHRQVTVGVGTLLRFYLLIYGPPGRSCRPREQRDSTFPITNIRNPVWARYHRVVLDSAVFQQNK